MTFEQRIGDEGKGHISMGREKNKVKVLRQEVLGVFSDYQRGQRGQGRVSKATTSMK